MNVIDLVETKRGYWVAPIPLYAKEVATRGFLALVLYAAILEEITGLLPKAVLETIKFIS